MKFISHRGNIDKIVKSEENKPDKILYCISIGYDVEIDVWNLNGDYYLGHDEPQYKVDNKFILNKSLWCHAKNLNSLESMLRLQTIKCFWHQKDYFTLTSNNLIWTYPGYELTENSIAVLPEKVNYDLKMLEKCYGICSDNIEFYKNTLKEK